MRIENVRLVDNVKNHYYAEIDGVPTTIVTRDGQPPEEVIQSLLDVEPTYIDKRLMDYPSVQDQLDMIYHDIDAWREKIATIKAKYPKD
jgi:hypothetical protein